MDFWGTIKYANNNTSDTSASLDLYNIAILTEHMQAHSLYVSLLAARNYQNIHFPYELVCEHWCDRHRGGPFRRKKMI